MQSGHNRPISAHFRSGDFEFAYFGEDLGESVGEPVEAGARMGFGQGAAEHLHGMLGGNWRIDQAKSAFGSQGGR